MCFDWILKPNQEDDRDRCNKNKRPDKQTNINAFIYVCVVSQGHFPEFVVLLFSNYTRVSNSKMMLKIGIVLCSAD